MQRSTKLLLGIAILLIVGLFVAANVRNRLNTAGKVAVAVYVLPQDASLKINGIAYHEGTTYLKPGDYTVTASKPGYKDYSRVYSIDPSTKKPIIDVILEGNSSAAVEYYAEHSDLLYLRQGLGAEQAHQRSALITAKNPLIKELPYDNLVYTIGYQSDPTDPTGQSVIIDIDAAIGYRNAAVDKIREMGYDPTDYKITFEGYVNPFTL